MAEVSLAKLGQNYRNLRECIPDSCKFMGMVKSDAYGYGAVPVARCSQELGADYLGVAGLDEALELRQNGITPSILILAGIRPEDTHYLWGEKIAKAVFDSRSAQILAQGAVEAGCLSMKYH